MRQFAAIFLLALGFASTATAQSFTERLKAKKAGEGTLTVNQSAAIDELVNNAKLTIQPQAVPQTKPPAADDRNRHTTTTVVQHHSDKDSASKKTEHHTAVPKREVSGDLLKESRTTTRQTEAEADPLDLANVKKVPRVTRKITGYRVQAFAGGNSRDDRQKAENIKNAIKARYPELPVYVHFYSPRWICRVGNFRTFEEASAVLKNIKAMGYSQACIVKGKINVGY